jgi:regulatory protein
MGSAGRVEDSSSANADFTLAPGGENAALLPVRNAALRLVSRAEQCAFLLSRKLLKKGFDAEAVKAVVLELTEAGMVNDSRFARMWLRSRLVVRADSPRRISAALRTKGVDKNTVEEAVRDCLNSETEQALLERFIKKRFRDRAEAAVYKTELRAEGFSRNAIDVFFEPGNRAEW